jgi:hypothetical protein
MGIAVMHLFKSSHNLRFYCFKLEYPGIISVSVNGYDLHSFKFQVCPLDWRKRSSVRGAETRVQYTEILNVLFIPHRGPLQQQGNEVNNMP